MSNHLSRRGFLQRSGWTAAGMAAAASRVSLAAPKAGANEKVRLGLIGSGNRGTANMLILLGVGAECVALADPDDSRTARAAAQIKAQGQQLVPDTYRDYRKILDRKDVDAVLIGTPDHWHAICTIDACKAGKDVFVEKPVSHNISEGRAMVQAARKYDRVAIVGTQQRSGPHFIEAKAYMDSGKLGRICLAKAWVTYRDKDLGTPPDGSPPAAVDYDLWLGPAPKRAFNPNRFHYQWRWFWDYAGGKQADWGIHLIDVVHWYMNVTAPRTVAAVGGKRILTDNRDTPDTQVTIFDYGDFSCNWEHRQGNGRPLENGRRHGIAFYGENGTLVITRGGWEVYPEGDRIEAPPKAQGKGETEMFTKHSQEFLNCIKSRHTPNADIEVGHRSTSACLLGNIAYRTGRSIRWDAQTEQILDDAEASRFLTREYRKPWELPTI